MELADLGAESRLLLGEVVAVLEHGVGRGHAVVHRVAEEEQELWASTHTQVRESRGRAACLGARVTGGVTRWCRVVARWGEVHGGWRTLGRRDEIFPSHGIFFVSNEDTAGKKSLHDGYRIFRSAQPAR